MTHPDRPGGVRVFLSTTDQSGDEHAAALIQEIRRLRPEAECAGLGGPQMAAVGCRLLGDTTHRSPAWFDTLREIPAVWRLLRRIGRFWTSWPPDVFVPIDSPGINFPLARRARAQGITNVYYIPPQIWAWGRWRIRKLRRLFDQVLVTMPFEEAFYRSRGLRVEFVGHPLFDYLPRRTLVTDFRDEIGVGANEMLVGLLPGSRPQEVRRLTPIFRDAAVLIRRRHPSARFAVGAAAPGLVPTIEAALAGSGLDAAVLVGRTLELMRDARLCLVASGTATLQLLHFATPMVVAYRLNRPEWCLMRLMKRSRYIGLVNVLAEKRTASEARGAPSAELTRHLPVPLVPELVSWHDRPDWVAERALPLLVDTPERTAALAGLQSLRAEVDHPGAVRRAAEAIIHAAEA